MRPALITLLLLICIAPAHATYVASGKADFAVGLTAACTPNAGGVTSGNALVLGIQANSTDPVVITSVPAATWTLDQTQTQAAGTVTTYLYHAFAPSSAVLIVTATFNPAVAALIGVMCGEWDDRTFDTSASTNGNAVLSVNITTTKAIADLVGFGSSGVGDSSAIVAPFTQRQSITYLGLIYATFGDQHVTSINTYAFSPNGSGTSTALVLALDAPIGTRHKSEIIQYHPPGNQSIIRTGGK